VNCNKTRFSPNTALNCSLALYSHLLKMQFRPTQCSIPTNLLINPFSPLIRGSQDAWYNCHYLTNQQHSKHSCSEQAVVVNLQNTLEIIIIITVRTETLRGIFVFSCSFRTLRLPYKNRLHIGQRSSIYKLYQWLQLKLSETGWNQDNE